MLQTCLGYSRTAGLGLAVAMQVLPSSTIAQTAPSPRLELTSPFSGTPQSLEGSVSGDFLVTTASSRILTLWSRSAQMEWQPRVIHAPPRDEYAGSYIGAISPDGNTIAFSVPPLSDGAGGYRWGTARIYMIERTSQQLIAVLSTGIPTRITRLKFSPDGNYLAGMLGQGCGVRLWTQQQWTNPEREQKPNYADDEGYGGTNGVSACCPGTDVSACEALPRGIDVLFTGVTDGSRPWMITLSENGLRSYIKPEQLPQRAGPDLPLDDRLKKAGRMALSPDGTTLAIGDVFQPQLAILTRDGLRFRWSDPRKIPDEMLNATGKGEAFLANPVWAQGGGRLLLYAFGYLPNSAFVGAPDGSNANRIAIFGPEAGDLQFVSLGADSDSSLYASQSGAPILFVSPRSLSAIDVGASEPRIIDRRIALDLRGNDDQWVLKLNKQRKQLYLSSPAGDTSSVAVTFDYAEMRIGDKRDFDRSEGLKIDVNAHDAAEGYYDAEAKPEWRFGFKISEKPAPAFFGTDINLEKLYRNEVSYSGAKLPDRNMAVWGTSHALRVIDSGGGIACTRPVGSPAFRMNLSPDARMVVVGHGDGTIRWYRLSDPGKPCLPLIASLYLTRNDDVSLGFLAWLPNGKFMTSGGAALKNLACYPADTPDNFGPCIDFQETNGLFSPSEVKRALAEADSTEGKATALAAVVATKQQEKPSAPAAIDIVSKFDTANRDLSITLTTTGLDGGPRYLTLVANAGSDLPFTIDGKEYSQAQAYRIDGRHKFTVVAKLPTNVLHKNQQISIHPVVSSAPEADASNRLQLSNQPVWKVLWTGSDWPPNKRKLWALLVGFSKAPEDVPQLQFAHEDAINFARLLQRDFQGDLPGKSSFNDIDIRLLVAAENVDASTLNDIPKIKMILAKLGDGRFHPDSPKAGDFVEATKTALKGIILDIKNTRRPDQGDWHDEILVYFAGHGFSNSVDGSRQTLQVGLVTPDSDLSLQKNVLWIDDLVHILDDSNVAKMLIIDACSAQIDKDDVPIRESIQLKLPAFASKSPFSLQFFLSSTLSHYSYEQQDYAVDDFIPGFKLWPNGVGTKGSGVFSLGLMASLLCREAVYKNGYTFDSSYRFLNDRFFAPTNTKWHSEIRPKLAELLPDRFRVPDPDAFGFPGGGSFSPVMRSVSTTVSAPQCGF